MKRLIFILFAASVLSGCNLFLDESSVGPTRCEIDCDGGTSNNALTCGDGLLQGSEKCDPGLPSDSPAACPETCDDGIACTADTLIGSAETCDAVCSSAPIEVCANNDGCCAPGCNAGNDTDCDDTAICGDGTKTGAETCDPGIESGSDACPLTADDCEEQQCKRAIVAGSAQNCDAVCAYADITTCSDGDGCCPSGCDQTNDDDCASECGNGITEDGETCDGNCPTSCDDGDPCTTDNTVGSAGTCNFQCENEPITAAIDGDMCCPVGADAMTDGDCSDSCGDGQVDAGETCDGDCPTTCDDMNACTSNSLVGSPDNCTAQCIYKPIQTCSGTMLDGCCPSGCNANNDSDCTPSCGNGAVESGETCEGNCPASCNDMNACTDDTLEGDPNMCTSFCPFDPVTACRDSDGCCPPSCNSLTDNDCGPSCGNGAVESGETCDGNCPMVCDDGKACTTNIRSGSATSCNVMCSYPDITTCIDNDGCCPSACNSQTDNDCNVTCGDNVVEGGELCDGNCPTESSCGVCETFVGGASTCDAQCLPIAGCVACSLNGTCPCGTNEECIGGTCQAATGDCTNACSPDLYCEASVGAGASCDANSRSCVECSTASDCSGPALGCFMGQCQLAPNCSQAKNPDVWCDRQESPKDTCIGTECFVGCTTDNDCGPTESCGTNNVCVPATSCNEANDRAAWCAAFEPGTNYCFNGDCFARCSPAGPSGACGCPDPSREACVFKSQIGFSLCERASLCQQICETGSNRSDFCAQTPTPTGCDLTCGASVGM